MTAHNEDITVLEWDSTGSKLMIGDRLGSLEIWAVKDHILSDWNQITRHAAFRGESVVTALWFHPGTKIGVSPDKKYELLPYQEKFSTIRFGSSVRSFGGRPAEGVLAISSSGLLWALVIQPDGSILVGDQILGQFRSRIKTVDMCYAKNGQFLVVTSNGSTQSSINCYQVSVKVENFFSQDKSKCSIISKPFTSFYLSPKAPTEESSVITHLKFVMKEGAEAVVIATSGSDGSTVELWELVELPIQVHEMFRKKKAKVEVEESKAEPMEDESCEKEEIEAVKTGTVWRHQASNASSSPVVSIGVPRLSLFDSSSPPSFIIVAYEDSCIKCLIRDQLREICRLRHPLLTTTKQGDGQPKFGQKMQSSLSTSNVTRMCDLQFTWTGSLLVAIDTLSQMYVYRVSPVVDPTTSHTSPQYAQMVLEYCLLTGVDAWDVLLGLKSQSIEPTCELLTSGFNRQSQALQAKHLTRLHELKGFLYRALPAKSSSSSGQVKAGDAHTTIMLNSVQHS